MQIGSRQWRWSLGAVDFVHVVGHPTPLKTEINRVSNFIMHASPEYAGRLGTIYFLQPLIEL